MASKKAKGGKGRQAMQRPPPPKPGERGPSGFKPWTLILFGLVFLVMFSEGLREQVGHYFGFALNPLIGFGGASPAVTLFLASVITGVSSGLIRHYLVDWLKMAESQETMKAFQRELRQARKDENLYKVKRLTELQPELMKIQSESAGQQFKPMGYTMIIVIPMFAWLWEFMSGLGPGASIFAPWGHTLLNTDARVVSFLPTWILLYSLFSIPIGQLVQKGLKAWEFSRTLKSQNVPSPSETS